MDTAQEALFRAMLNEGWTTESDGENDFPLGYFGYMVNLASEWEEVRMNFGEIIDAYGEPKANEFIGNWVVRVSNSGCMAIERYRTRQEMDARYLELVREYTKWLILEKGESRRKCDNPQVEHPGFECDHYIKGQSRTGM